VSPIPENFKKLHQGEEFLRTKTYEAIEADEDLSRHVAVTERIMDFLNVLSAKPPSKEDEDTKAVRLLGMRLFNGCAAALQLIVTGYYQNAAMIMRDLLETVFLLGFLGLDRTKISEWRTADDATRKKVFAPIKIRTALDENDGFTGKKRAEAYNILSELASHPTYKGFRMLAPKGSEHHCGPFFDFSVLKPLIEQLASLAVQAGANINPLIEDETKEIAMASVDCIEVSGEWFERYFEVPFDRKKIKEMKALLNQRE
jgi:hypothetical protein